MKPLFSRKLICTHCSKNFKAKKERNKRRYVCQTYDHGKGCKRIVMDEEFLKEVVNKRYDYKLSDEEIAEKVTSIEVKDKLLFTINLKNDEPIIFSENFVQY